MRVGTKLTLALAIPIVVVNMLFAFLDTRLRTERDREEIAKAGRALALTLQLALEDAMRHQKMEDIREVTHRLTDYEQVLGLRIFDAAGVEIYQSPTLRDYPFTGKEALDDVLENRRMRETRRFIAEWPVVTHIVPVSGPDNQIYGAVQVVRHESFLQKEARASRGAILILTAVMVALTSGIIIVVTGSVVGRPIQRLVRSFRDVGSGDLHARVPASGNDELAGLAGEFNTMCERLERLQESLVAEQRERLVVERRLRHAEELAALGRMAAGLAHEIGTPLNVISGRAESMLRHEALTEQDRRSLQIISEQIDRISRIVSRMLRFARPREIQFTAVSIPGLLRGVMEFLHERLVERNIEIRSEIPASLADVLGDADHLHEVFLNLCVNAIDAMPNGGRLTIRAGDCRRAPPSGMEGARYLAIVLEDTGCGIPEENLGRVFDPFFTTKGIGEGTGLGLSVSHGIVTAHGGWIDIESKVGEGTIARVCLPVADQPPPRKVASEDRE